MTETTEKPEPQHSQNLNKKPAESTAPQPTGTPIRSSKAGWIALAFSLVALAMAGYVWRESVLIASIESGEQVNRIAAVEQRFDDFSSAQDDLGAQVSQMESRLAGAQEDFARQIDRLRSEIRAQQANSAVRDEEFRQDIQSLSDSVVQLHFELYGGVDSWRLKEVEQLLLIANDRLHFAEDVGLAGWALKLADSRLRQLADPALVPVRGMLAREIASLDAVATVDVAGTLNALSEIARGVDDLPLAGDVMLAAIESARPPASDTNDTNGTNGTNETNTNDTNNTNNTTDTPSSTSNSLWAAGKSLLADLGALVQVETGGNTAAPILSPELRLMIFEKAKLILESAQLAFLRQRDDVYAARMEEARDWVVANFDGESAEVDAWLAQLDEVAAVAPAASLPDISASLRALRKAMRAAAGR